jgi:hypothetical protein
MQSRPFARSFFGPLRLATALAVGIWIVPAPALAHEAVSSRTSKVPQSSYEVKAPLGVASSEIQRGNAYARAVWMPEIATSSVGGSDISFGVARLNPMIRRGLGVESSGFAAAAPVVSLQLSRRTSVTFIKLLGDAEGAMIALQMKLGS